jgi:hypothetical protein
MKITVEETKKTKQVWPQTPFLAYDVEFPHIIMLVIDDKIIFLNGNGNMEKYPYVGMDNFSQRIEDTPHALYTGKIILEN